MGKQQKKWLAEFKLEAFIAKTKGNLRAFKTYASSHDPKREKVEGKIEPLELGLERLKVWDKAALREKARSDKHTARVLLPDQTLSKHQHSESGVKTR